MDVRGCQKFGIKVYWRLQFLRYIRTLSLKFQKARTKIEAVLTLPCWLSQFSWDSQLGRVRTTSVLVRAFWNFKLKVLKYSRNCSLHNTLIPWSLKKSWITYSTYIPEHVQASWRQPCSKKAWKGCCACCKEAGRKDAVATRHPFHQSSLFFL